MKGNPAQFEAIGSRLGFRVTEESDEKLRLIWQGPRFPAFLCLGIALLLMFISVPIAYAIRLNGFSDATGSLWYFPFMNFILCGISLYLLSQKRTIVVDSSHGRITLTRRSLHRTNFVSVVYPEIKTLRLGMDQVYSGFALAGSSAAESFPVPALRLVTITGESILLDRGSFKKMQDLGKRIGCRVNKPLELEPALATQLARRARK
jgi:hypothetical protein